MQRSRIILLVLVGSLGLVGLLVPAAGLAQSARSGLLDQAEAAYEEALGQDQRLREMPPEDRTRADTMRVIQLYRQVYRITPHTGYADDAIVNAAALYEAIDEPAEAVRFLEFLLSDYPSSRHVRQARLDIARLENGPPDPVAAVQPAGGFPEPGSSVSVNAIRYWDAEGALRVVVDMFGSPIFRRGSVDNPPRAYVDIRPARLGPGMNTDPILVGSGHVQDIRVGQYDADTVRVVLDLDAFRNIESFTLADPDRLIIDVLNREVASTELTPDPIENTANAPPPPVRPTPEIEASRVAEPATPVPAVPDRVGTPAQPNGHGDHSLVRSLGLKIGRVVIDPGHGGHDTGTIGPSGLTEKELVLDIALRLKEQIESKLGAEVMLTRADDSFIPLEDRASIANQSGADLFLSIHANSSRADSIRGFETYALNVTTSRDELEIAARENASSQASISDFEGILEKIMLQDKLDESLEFAAHIQKALADKPQFGRDRGVKQAPFMVLIGANMPSILAEISFISNPEDERLLKSDERRQEFADALFEGVRSYADTLSAFRTAQVQN